MFPPTIVYKRVFCTELRVYILPSILGTYMDGCFKNNLTSALIHGELLSNFDAYCRRKLGWVQTSNRQALVCKKGNITKFLYDSSGRADILLLCCYLHCSQERALLPSLINLVHLQSLYIYICIWHSLEVSFKRSEILR